jgi:NTE family protein
LALGSGGAKGLAHIGVIKVLEENNVPIDYIAGSSIGALIGGFYAVTRDIKEIEQTALKTNWRQMLSLIDPSLHLGLLGGEKVRYFIESNIDKIHFENLKIPLSVIATDIRSGEVVSINEGDVASAIRASISFPLVFEPVKREMRLLADGGLSLPVPVETVRKMGAEIVIAVNLDDDYFSTDQNNSFGFYKIANNSINLLRHHLSLWNVKNADIVISPKTGPVKWDKFIDGKNIILSGEEAAKGIIAEIVHLIKPKREELGEESIAD